MAGELLQASQYEQVSAILRTAQTNSAHAGDAVLARMLEAAGRLCLALIACQADAEWHRQATRQTEQREQELRQELYEILELLGSGEVSHALPAPEQPPCLPSPPASPTVRHSLWNRIQARLRHKTSPSSSAAVQVETRAAAAAPPSTASTRPVQVLRPAPGLDPEAVSPDKPRERPKSPSLVVYCLGPFRVYQDDQLIADWDSLKGKSVLKYLVAHHETPVSKDVLMDLFWPDADPEAARRNLHQAIYNLRQTLRRGRSDFMHVRFEEDCYVLDERLQLWIDCQEFERHVQEGRRLQAEQRPAEAIARYGVAESLYQGDYLEEDLYEDWPMARRERLRRIYCDLIDRLSEHYVRREEYNAAIALCQRVLLRDNCHEGAHRRLMRCYLALGHRHLAVRQYQTCARLLREELDLAPSAETTALYQRTAHAGEPGTEP